MPFTKDKNFHPKAPNSSVSKQLTTLIEWIAVEAGPMILVKEKEVRAFLVEVEADIAAKRLSKPLLMLGTDSGNLLIRVEGERSYEKQVLLVKEYVRLRAAHTKAIVVNAHSGDAIIDRASADMASAKGTTAQKAANVDLKKQGGTTPIIILAHGSPTSSLSGTVYATEFAKQKPEQIVSFLADTKGLDKNYAGVIYLDGCYTAAGPKQGRDQGELTNFAKKVYDGLLKRGYEYLQVKGNLGRAATQPDGTEKVLDAQDEVELNKQLAALEKTYEALEKSANVLQDRVNKLKQVAAALVAKHNSNAQTLSADVGVMLVKQEVAKLEVLRNAANLKFMDAQAKYFDLEVEMRPRGSKYITGLVGVFGPHKLSSETWYQKLFPRT